MRRELDATADKQRPGVEDVVPHERVEVELRHVDGVHGAGRVRRGHPLPRHLLQRWLPPPAGVRRGAARRRGVAAALRSLRAAIRGSICNGEELPRLRRRSGALGLRVRRPAESPDGLRQVWEVPQIRPVLRRVAKLVAPRNERCPLGLRKRFQDGLGARGVAQARKMVKQRHTVFVTLLELLQRWSAALARLSDDVLHRLRVHVHHHAHHRPCMTRLVLRVRRV
mmetsp:Transcript_40678/g.82002  ORF Transcript_40678/g.82002 Transcript_40678/m.82002 type:complete len:225 (-) Transcript_40678:560-1234(-)